MGNQAIGEDRTTNTTTTTTGTRTMTWDWENRLRKVKDDQMEVTYDYDADGERRLKTLGTVETIYADRLYEVENGSARQLATVNVYLGDTRLVSKVVPLNSPSVGYEQQNTYYYHADHIGNSTLVTDYLGREYERFAFTPHGEIWQQSSLDTLDKVEYLFTGKQMDAETGWYNFGARYLNPKTGLWLSSDPALGEYIPKAPLTDEDKEANKKLPGMGGIYNPINFALYHFAGNNPVKYTDPDGRETTALPAIPGWARQLGIAALAYGAIDAATNGGLTNSLNQANNAIANAGHRAEDWIGSLFAAKSDAKPVAAATTANTKASSPPTITVMVQLNNGVKLKGGIDTIATSGGVVGSPTTGVTKLQGIAAVEAATANLLVSNPGMAKSPAYQLAAAALMGKIVNTPGVLDRKNTLQEIFNYKGQEYRLDLDSYRGNGRNLSEF